MPMLLSHTVLTDTSAPCSEGPGFSECVASIDSATV